MEEVVATTTIGDIFNRKLVSVKIRSGFKTSDQDQGPPQIAGFHFLILCIKEFKRRQADRESAVPPKAG